MKPEEWVLFLRHLAHSLAADLASRSPPVRLTAERLANYGQWLQVRINGEKLGLILLPETRDHGFTELPSSPPPWSERQKQIWRRQIDAFLESEHKRPRLSRK
jgi:hypothetical protein